MRKVLKAILIIIAVVIALCLGFWAFLIAVFRGAFAGNTEIARYQSPDKEHVLVIEQIGDPAFPFGPTEVRATLKNQNGKKIKQVPAILYHDGACAHEDNIKSVSWGESAVVIVFTASEMQDLKVVIEYDN